MKNNYFSGLPYAGMVASLCLIFNSLPAMADNNDCQLTLSQSGIDYGAFRQSEAVDSKQSRYVMPEKEVNVNVYCPRKQKIAVFVQGMADAQGNFIFGDTETLAIKVGGVVIDGKHYGSGKTADRINFTPLNREISPEYLHNNEAVIAVENNTVPFGQQMSFSVKLSPILSETAFSHNSDQFTLQSDLGWQVMVN